MISYNSVNIEISIDNVIIFDHFLKSLLQFHYKLKKIEFFPRKKL